jgi:hypothetical protein
MDIFVCPELKMIRGNVKPSIKDNTLNYFPANTQIELITFPPQEQFCYINSQTLLAAGSKFQCKH